MQTAQEIQEKCEIEKDRGREREKGREKERQSERYREIYLKDNAEDKSVYQTYRK